MVDHMTTTHSTQRAVSTVRWVQILMLLGGVNLASSPIRGCLSLGISGRANPWGTANTSGEKKSGYDRNRIPLFYNFIPSSIDTNLELTVVIHL